jgi:hypothetical protein
MTTGNYRMVMEMHTFEEVEKTKGEKPCGWMA